MNLILSVEAARAYESSSQKIRVMTEQWVEKLIYCPRCGNALNGFEHNKPVADFYCEACREEYELKSKKGSIGRKIVDGAYLTMIQRLNAENNPNFFFLTYHLPTFTVRNFLVIPKYFFVPGIVERRTPLSSTARRAGWMGCNILVSNIPEFGKIFYVQDGLQHSKQEVLSRWSQTEFIGGTHNVEAKGWLLDVLTCVERIGKRDFSLGEVYRFEQHLKAKHRSNNNIQAKIRQQLQFLRDKDVIDFIAPGRYRLRA